MKKDFNFIPGGIYNFGNLIFIVLVQTEGKVLFHRTDKYLKQKLNSHEEIIEGITIFIGEFLTFNMGDVYKVKELYNFLDKQSIDEPTGFLGCISDEMLEYLINIIQIDYQDFLFEELELYELFFE